MLSLLTSAAPPKTTGPAAGATTGAAPDATPPGGRLWAGTLNGNDKSRPDGQLFRLDPNG